MPFRFRTADGVQVYGSLVSSGSGSVDPFSFAGLNCHLLCWRRLNGADLAINAFVEAEVQRPPLPTKSSPGCDRYSRSPHDACGVLAPDPGRCLFSQGPRMGLIDTRVPTWRMEADGGARPRHLDSCVRDVPSGVSLVLRAGNYWQSERHREMYDRIVRELGYEASDVYELRVTEAAIEVDSIDFEHDDWPLRRRRHAAVSRFGTGEAAMRR